MFFICTFNASKVIFVTFNLNCRLHAVSVGQPPKQSVKHANGRQIFGHFGFQNQTRTNFWFSAHLWLQSDNVTQHATSYRHGFANRHLSLLLSHKHLPMCRSQRPATVGRQVADKMHRLNSIACLMRRNFCISLQLFSIHINIYIVGQNSKSCLFTFMVVIRLCTLHFYI